MSTIIRKCDVCNKEYEADTRNLKRGWGLCCCKSCAAKKRERSKPTYNHIRVKKNNYRRLHWNDRYIDTEISDNDVYDALDGCQWGDFDIGCY